MEAPAKNLVHKGSFLGTFLVLPFLPFLVPRTLIRKVTDYGRFLRMKDLG